jgi:hypothetical protein
LRAYALGLIGPDHPDYPRVAGHLEECEPCRRYVMTLRGLAAVLPPVVPFGHGIATGVAHVYRLLGSGHAAATASTSTGSGVLAGTGAASSGSSGGLIGVLGGGAAKTFAIAAAGIAAAGAVTVHAVIRHHRPVSETQQAQRQSFATTSEVGVSDELGQAPRAWPFSRPQRTSPPVRRRESPSRRGLVRRAVAREPVSAGQASSPPLSSASTGGVRSASGTSPSSSESEGSGGEFGFEGGG